MTNTEVAKKSLGQHWLTDKSSLLAMVKEGRVEKSDLVVEIGPGHGSLTEKLVEAAGQVVAIELDGKLADQLPSRVPSPTLSVVKADVLRFDFTSLPADYKLIANIPYYLTGHLLRILTETSNQPKIAALLVQKEVAQRVAAEPGDMSIISVSVQLFYDVSLGRTVPAKLFDPPPKVDSQILVLTRRAQPLFPGLDYPTFFRIVKAGFSSKRKTLLNALSAGLALPKATVADSLVQAQVDPRARAQTLPMDQWNQLTQVLASQLD